MFAQDVATVGIRVGAMPTRGLPPGKAERPLDVSQKPVIAVKSVKRGEQKGPISVSLRVITGNYG